MRTRSLTEASRIFFIAQAGRGAADVRDDVDVGPIEAHQQKFVGRRIKGLARIEDNRDLAHPRRWRPREHRPRGVVRGWWVGLVGLLAVHTSAFSP